MGTFDVKRGIVVIFLMTVLLLNIRYAAAFGISAPYFENNTINLRPGQYYEYILTIQNGDDEDYYANITYSSTQSIASLRSNYQYIPAKTYDTKFYFDIHIPDTSKPGDKYRIDYSAKPIKNDTGEVPMSVEIDRYIDIFIINNNGTMYVQPSTNTSNISINNQENDFWKYILGAIIACLATLIVHRLWTLSKGISIKVERKNSTQTISESKSTEDLKTILDVMDVDIYETPLIKKIISEKLEELEKKDLSRNILKMTKKELMRRI